MSYYLREQPTMTLEDLAADLDNAQGGPTTTIDPEDTRVTLEGSDLMLAYRQATQGAQTEPRTEVRLGKKGLTGFAQLLDIPASFLTKAASNDPELAQYLLARYLGRYPGEIGLRVAEGVQLNEVFDPDAWRIDPRQLVEVVAGIMSPDSLVVAHDKTASDFRMDVSSRFDMDTREVGDIRGGLRVGLSTTSKLAPWVNPYTYTLICTNGMETVDDDLRFDARGMDVNEVMIEFEMMARRAFSRVDDAIHGLQALREQPVNDLSQALVRVGQEHNLPERVRMELVERVPAYLEETNAEPTMFDVINLVTNQANAPRLRNRYSARQQLERAGGSVVSDHADRCSHCLSKLTS